MARKTPSMPHPKHIAVVVFCAAAGWFCTAPATAQDRYFYRRVDYGSEALYNPVAAVINGSLGILQYPNLSRKLSEIPYATGLRNVTWNLSHPFQAIASYGWYDFV